MIDSSHPLATTRPYHLARLERFAETGQIDGDWMPWSRRLAPEELLRLRADLTTLLHEPEETGEPIDHREVLDLLEEFAASVGWEGTLLTLADEPLPVTSRDGYRIDLRPADEKELERAPAQIRQDLQRLLATFLPYFPTSGDRLPCGRIKKMSNRGIWQVQLAAGYRLRYLVDEAGGVVYIVYLGPHPEGQEDGREASVRAAVRRSRHGGNPSPAGSRT